MNVKERRAYWAEFGARVRAFRQRAGLTQEQLGQLAHIGQNNVCAIEKGKVLGISLHKVRPLAKALGVSVDELI